MNYEILAIELALPAYSGLSDQAAADALNAPTVTVTRNIPIGEIAEWASQNGIMPTLYAAERDPETPAALYGAIRTLLTILTPNLLDSWKVIGPTGEPTHGASNIMGGLLSAGMISEAQIAELLAMAQTKTSPAAQLGLGQVTAGDVERARKGVW